MKTFVPPQISRSLIPNIHLSLKFETVALRYEGFNLSARATKNSVIIAQTAIAELIFRFSDIKIGGGGVLAYPCRSPGGPALTPPQRGSGCSWCSWAEVSGREKKGGRAKTQKFVFVYTLGIRCVIKCGPKEQLRVFLRFVPTPRLEKVISGKPRESKEKMKTKVVASKASIYHKECTLFLTFGGSFPGCIRGTSRTFWARSGVFWAPIFR